MLLHEPFINRIHLPMGERLMKIKFPECPHCGSKKTGILEVDAPFYDYIYVLFVCRECKKTFLGKIEREES